MAIVKIKKPNGEIMETIDGEYVIGYGEGCHHHVGACQSDIIGGEYLVERSECCPFCREACDDLRSGNASAGFDEDTNKWGAFKAKYIEIEDFESHLFAYPDNYTSHGIYYNTKISRCEAFNVESTLYYTTLNFESEGVYKFITLGEHDCYVSVDYPLDFSTIKDKTSGNFYILLPLFDQSVNGRWVDKIDLTRPVPIPQELEFLCR